MAKTPDDTRRVFLKKAAYVAPLVLTFQATSAVAKAGSEKEPREPKGAKLQKEHKKVQEEHEHKKR